MKDKWNIGANLIINHLIHIMNVPYIETMIFINNNWPSIKIESLRFKFR